MPRDMEQMQLLMALSLYLNSVKDKPVTLVPATPEMLFGSGVSEEEIEDEAYEYEEEDDEMEEEDEISLATLEDASLDWASGSRIMELGYDGRELVESSDLIQPV